MEVRTNLELWLIVEENFDKHFSTGLCRVFFKLMSDDIINSDEHCVLYNLIQDYKKSRFYCRKYGPFYLWEKGHAKPRRMFIQKQILKELRNEFRKIR